MPPAARQLVFVGIGPVVTVDTGQPVDIAGLASAVRARLAAVH